MNIQIARFLDGTDVCEAEFDLDRPADCGVPRISAVLSGSRELNPVRRVQVNTHSQSIQPELTHKPIKQHRIAG